MRNTTISLIAILIVTAAMIVSPLPLTTHAQTQNQTTKFQVTESFTFPNTCTNEVMDVSDTTTVTCHDQQREGSAVNTIITFDDLVKKENCVLTTDHHLVSFDCRGSKP